MKSSDFLNKHFPGIELHPPLFYHWNIGIRFELGVDYYREEPVEDSPYLLGVYKRATTLFHSLHSHDEEMYIVVDVMDTSRRKLKRFSHYLRDPSLLYRLHHQIIGVSEEVERPIHRFTLRCTPSDVNITSLIKAICNQDLGIIPSIFHRVYFINRNRKTIFHIYDDRGCDVLAASPETIRAFYHNFNDWILDYDRVQIDAVFN